MAWSNIGLIFRIYTHNTYALIGEILTYLDLLNSCLIIWIVDMKSQTPHVDGLNVEELIPQHEQGLRFL